MSPQYLRVRMRDGIELAVRITRPGGEGPFPVLMSCSPYRMLGTQRPAARESEYSTFYNAAHHLAGHGYISVQYDVRGTGSSAGAATDLYSEADRQDGYDMIEWIAAQPWSNGCVGMWGFSYGGVITWQVAALAPPHLKAIIVGSGTDDVYRDWAYPGGLPRPFVLGPYAALMTACNFAPPDPDFADENWEEIWEARLRSNEPWSLASLEHPTDGPYWRARSLSPDYGRIRCPAFVISGWADWYPSAMLRVFSELKVPKRALIGPWGHFWPEDAVPGPRVDARPEYLKWFDQFLKGIDTGVLEEPPITIFVQAYPPPPAGENTQRGFWRSECEWPLARTEFTPLYLSAQGRLESQANASEEVDRYRYQASVGAGSGLLAISPALDQHSDEAHSLTYTTPPLEADLELTGTPTAEIFVSSTARVLYVHVRLCDVAPDGVSTLLSDGGEKSGPLDPGSPHRLEFPLRSLAAIIPAGHRLRIAVSSADFQNAWPVSEAATHSVLRGKAFPSRVTLPVAPPQSPVLPAPALRPSPNPLPELVTSTEHRITHDPLNQTTTLTLGSGAQRTVYTVSNCEPAKASLESHGECRVAFPGKDIRVEACAVTESDARAFAHRVDVEITVNGQPHFHKSWTRSIPRSRN